MLLGILYENETTSKSKMKTFLPLQRLDKTKQSEKKSKNNAFSKICLDLNKLRSNQQFTDAILETEDGGTFFAHKLLLFTGCKFFQKKFAMFDGIERIKIPNMSSATLSVMLDFFYTRKLRVTEDNYIDLLKADEKLKFTGFMEQCCEFLNSSLKPKNCVTILNISRKYECLTLAVAALTFIASNFLKLLTYKSQVVQLNLIDLILILGSDKLNTWNEEFVWKAIEIWIDYNSAIRHRYLAGLLENIRFEMCHENFIKELMEHPYLVENSKCETIEDVEYPSPRSQLVELEKNLPSHHRYRIPHELLFVFGGWNTGSATNLLEVYDNRAGKWVLSTFPDKLPRAYHGLAELQNLIYIIGGFDGHHCVSSVRQFDPLAHKWVFKCCMHEARCYVSVAVLGNHIYALGGYDGHRRTNTAERYNPTNNQWSMIPPMSRKRSDASAAVHQGKVYIAGGFDGQEVMRSVEVFDPLTDIWEEISSMVCPRSGVSLINYKNYLYVLGGWDGISRLTSCERLEHNGWHLTSNMITPRSNFATAIVEEKLFAIGGFNGSTTIPYVECYDYRTNNWESRPPLNVNRSALNACVLVGIKNATIYIRSKESEILTMPI